MVPKVQVTPLGTLILTLKDYMVEITTDSGIFITDLENGVSIVSSACEKMSAIDHPMGRIFGYMSKIEIQAPNQKGIRFAKIWKKGVSFTTENKATTYLLDAGGPKTTVDWFLSIDEELFMKTFCFNSQMGRLYDAMAIFHESQYWMTEVGQENWNINNLRICQYLDGRIRILKNFSDFQVYLNPTQGSIRFNTPFFYCTASLGYQSHLFVRNEDRRIHYDGYIFAVRNSGQASSIDHLNQLKLH